MMSSSGLPSPSISSIFPKPPSPPAELTEQPAESLESLGSPATRLRLFLEPAENRGEQRVGALFRHRGRNAQFLRHRFDAAGLRQNIGQIFGSKDVSRTVAGQAAAQTGIDTGILKQMLPMLAMMAAGYMAKQGGQDGANGGLSGGLGGMLGNVLGGAMGGGAAPSAGGLGGIGKMLDMDGDGNPLDDIMGMVNKMRG